MGSLDNMPDGIPLDELERAKHRFKLEEKQTEALEYIRKNLPIAGFEQLMGETLWLREILKDMEGEAKPCKFCKAKVSSARTKAIQLFGEWLGVIGSKAKKKSKRDVIFDDSE